MNDFIAYWMIDEPNLITQTNENKRIDEGDGNRLVGIKKVQPQEVYGLVPDEMSGFLRK